MLDSVIKNTFGGHPWKIITMCIVFTHFYIGSLLAQSWTDKNENENYTARHECSFVQAGNRFYLMGGRENARTLDVYNYSNNSWTSLVNSAPVEFNHYQATEYEGLIWVIGAFKTNTFPNEEPADFVWIFDPAEEEWIQGPAIPNSRKRGSSGLVVHNGKFYIIAGNTAGHSGGYVPWLDSYDPETGSWQQLPNAPRARDHFHAAVIGNNLYAVGGRRSGGTGGTFKPVIPEVDVFNLSSLSWSTLPQSQNLPTPRGAPSVAVFNNRLLVIGGEVRDEIVYGQLTTDALNITEEYNPANGSWTRIGDLNHERHGTQAIVSGGGVFVTAGSPNLGGGSQKNMEYLGADNPSGNPSLSSTLTAPSVVSIASGGSETFDLQAINGNIGIFITSVSISGPDAADFSLISESLDNVLLRSNSSRNVEVAVTSGGENRSATLTINYGNSFSLSIQLQSGNAAPMVTNPGTQMNVEGESVALQIEATDSSPNLDYSAINLPAGVSINNNTGLISGDIDQDAATNSPYATSVTVEDDGIPTGSTTINFNWIISEDVNLPPQAVAMATPQSGTAPLQVSFSSTGSSDDSGITSYLWNFDDGSSSDLPNPDHTYQNPGIYNVELTVTDGEGLSDTASLQISVVPANQPPMAVAGASPLSGISPLLVNFSSQGSTDDTGIVSYLWNFDDGNSSGIPNPEHTFQDPGIYNVILTVTDEGGLSDTATIQISVTASNQAPMAVATATPLFGAVPLAVSFTGSASTDDIGITSYYWDFGDGNTSDMADPVHTYTSPGNYTSYLTVTDDEGLQSSDAVNITVSSGNQPPVALASADPLSGEAPLEVELTGSLSSDDQGIISFFWDFDDGSTSDEADPSHLFTVPGTYDVNLTVMDNEGLFDTASLVITVETANQPPLAIASANPLTGIAPLEVSFNGADSMDDTGITSYYWNFGDGFESSDIAPVHTFLNPGEYNVLLEVTDTEGATNSANLVIIVLEQEIPMEEDSTFEAVIIENPVRSGIVKLSLSNSSPDRVALNFNLHDISGRLIQSTDAQQYFSTDGIFEIPWLWLKDGIYLFGVDFNQGDPLQFKIIVRN